MLLIQDSLSDFRIVFDGGDRSPDLIKLPLLRVNQTLVPFTSASLSRVLAPLQTDSRSLVAAQNLLESNLILQEQFTAPLRLVLHLSTFPRQIPFDAEKVLFFRP